MAPDRAVTSAALRDALRRPLWLDDPARPAPRDPLDGEHRVDLAVIGAGFTGLWSALVALEADPSRSVALLEAREVASAASGRNGGFVDASLTHGLANGVGRFPSQIGTLERLGLENLDAIEATVAAEGIDAHFERNGAIDVATEPWQLAELDEAAALARAHGHDVELLGECELRAEIASPTYLGGLRTRQRTAIVHPARLAWGLADAIEHRGGRIYEASAVRSLAPAGEGVALTTASGRLLAQRAVLATSAFPPLVGGIRSRVLPVYDYVLATEPLSPAQREAIGWRNREGLADVGNQFHYYRLTADDRIVFGGYDAVYYYNNGLRDELAVREPTFERLASHFLSTFPQLEGVRFSHAWGGAIDTCSRFCVFFGQALEGRVAYAAGFTGLGVGASRFAGEVLVDLVTGRASDRLDLELVRRRPVPFPPEPLRAGVVNLTRWSLARADRRGGRRNAWLQLLDRLGLGFDS